MNYFLNVNLGASLTGIEHAAINRLNLFKKNNVPAKIVTARYNTNLHYNMKNFGLDEDDVLNMYDFFQESIEVKEESIFTLHNICNEATYRYEHVAGTMDYRIYYQNRYIMYVHCVDLETKQVGYINYFDQDRRKIKREIFDCRGFKSQEKVLGDQQVLLAEFFYTPTGKKVIEKYYKRNENGKSELTSISLLQYKNRNFFFYSEEELITFFLDEMTRQGHENEICLFSDKSKIFVPSLLEMENRVKKIPIIHSVHVQNPLDVKNSNTTGVYRELLSNYDSFDAIVVSTEEQKRDIINRFLPKCSVLDIPVGFVTDCADESTVKRKNNKIISVARYYVEKRLDHIIKAFNTVQKELPDAELHLFGFGDARDNYKVEKELRKLVSDLNLSDKVFFRGYSHSLEEEYASSELFMLTSRVEGFCLALLEAVSNGIPCVSYNIKYGPSDMIQSGVNGYLVENGNIDELAVKMLDILKDDAKKEVFSNNCYEAVKKFSETAVWNKWESLLRGIQHVQCRKN